MRLWVISDLHFEQRPPLMQLLRPEAFDVLIVAGDVHDDPVTAIETVVIMADGRPAIYVAGNHEMAQAEQDPVLAAEAGLIAGLSGVSWLERSTEEIGGVRFAGATLWEPGHPQHFDAVKALQAANADVIVTHYPPVPSFAFRVLPEGGLWIWGHHHGHSDTAVAERRWVRNALGYPDEEVDRPAIADLVIEIGV